MRRFAVALVLGVVAVAVVDLLLPERPGSGLRATLVALPLVAVLVNGLRRRLSAPPSGPATRLLALAWVGVALWGGGLGLLGFERAWFAAGVVGLGGRCAALLPALRRWIGRRGAGAWPEVAALAFTLGFAVLPWAVNNGSPLGDEPYYLLQAESLASDGDVDLADEYRQEAPLRLFGRELAPQPGDPVGPAGEQLSRHEATLPLLLTPLWSVGGVFGARLGMLLIWSLTAGAVLRLLVAFELPPRAVFRAALVASVAPPVALYAHAVWVEVPAALAATVALELWARSRRPDSPLAGRRLALFVAAVAVLPLLKLRLLGIALPIAALPLVTPRARRSARLAAIGAVVLSGLAMMIGNFRSVGRPLRAYAVADLVPAGVSPESCLLALDGLLFDAAFGLLAWAPVWWLALAGAGGRLVRDRWYRWAIAAFVPYLALIASLPEWFGGWSPPFRYGIVLVPLLAVGLGHAWRRPLRPLAARLVAAFGALTALLLLAALVEPGSVTSFADGRSRWIDLASAPFAADLARFFPSAVRPRTATWLVPAALLALAALATVGRRAARARAAFDGVALLLLAGAALVVAAHRLPTRTVEAEDPWLERRGGTVYPGLWTMGRTRFVGGWLLAPEEELGLRPVAGGSRLRGRVRFRALAGDTEPVELEIASDGRPLGRWRVAPGDDWRVGEIAADWRAGQKLGLGVRALPPPAPVEEPIRRIDFEPPSSASEVRAAPRTAVLIDRLELDWSDHEPGQRSGDRSDHRPDDEVGGAGSR